jgi:hypothetical protein
MTENNINNPLFTTRRTGAQKNSNPPKELGRTLIKRNTFRFQSYSQYSTIPEVIKRIPKPTLFKKRYLHYLKCNDDLPENKCIQITCVESNDCKQMSQ